MYVKYLITGILNPLGKLIAQTLVDNGLSVRALVPPETDLSGLDGLDIETVEGEIFDKDSMKEFFTVDDPRHSVLLHLEEVVNLSGKSDLSMRRINVAGTINVVDQCLKNKIGRLVYLGSAYSINPNASLENAVLHFDRTKVEGDYAKSKAEASAYIMEKVSLNRLNAVLLLPTFIIGPGFDDEYDMNRILKKYLENHVSIVRGGHAFVDVRDVAEALLAICESGQSGASYILNGEHKNSKDFFQDVSKANGTEESVKTAPRWIMGKTLGKFADTYYRIAKKDNPKEVYALFMNNPDQQFESTVDSLMPSGRVRTVYDSINDLLHLDQADLTVKMAGMEESGEEAEVAEEKSADEPTEEASEETPEAEAASEAEEVGETTEEVADEQTEETAEEAAPEANEITAESADEAEAAEEESADDPTEEASEETPEAEAATEAEEAGETTEEVAEEAADEQTEETAEEAAPEANEITEESGDEAEAAEESADEPTEEASEETPEAEVAPEAEEEVVPIWNRTQIDDNFDDFEDM